MVVWKKRTKDKTVVPFEKWYFLGMEEIVVGLYSVRDDSFVFQKWIQERDQCARAHCFSLPLL